MGYTGPLCSACEQGYSKTALKYCLRCKNLALTIVKMIGVTMTIIIFIAVYSFVFIFNEEKLMKESIKTKKVIGFTLERSSSVYFKIFLNYLQMLGTLMQGDLSLPSHLQSYLSFTSVFGTAPTQLIAIDCIFHGIKKKKKLFTFLLKILELNINNLSVF